MICAIVVVVVELLKKIPPSYEETKHQREKAVLKDWRSHLSLEYTSILRVSVEGV